VRNKISQSQKKSEKVKIGRYKAAMKRKENTVINYGFDSHEESVNIIGNLHFNEKMTFKEIKEKFNASHGFVQNRIKEYKDNYLNKDNHKVKSVRFIGYDNVYDFTVDKYHNFALSAGVFVHNCFGERQHPEKFIPMCIKKVLNDDTIYIHSDSTKTISGTRH
jgi:intein/homing endonuclease